MTVRVTKPAVNLREKITELESNNADEARIGSLVSDSIDAVAIDAESLVVDGDNSAVELSIRTENPVQVGSTYGQLTINGASGGVIQFTDDDVEKVRMLSAVNDLQIMAGNAAGTIQFRTGGFAGANERARIDSSGNLLVGATTTTSMSDGVGNDGCWLSPSGTLVAARTSNVTAVLNRLSTDGAIANFSKDGTVVGSVATYGSALLVDFNTMTVASLPTASTVTGARAMVSDSTVAASGNFGATVAGSGSNVVPVFSDGTNWLIG